MTRAWGMIATGKDARASVRARVASRRARVRASLVVLTLVGTLFAPTAAPGASLALTSATVSPDGARVVAFVRLEAAGRVLVTVHDAAGERVRSIARQAIGGGAAMRVEWDGRDDRGRVVPDGAYRFRVRASARRGPSTVREASVVVDGAAPWVRWRAISPEPVRTAQPLRLTFSIWDADRTLHVALAVVDPRRERALASTEMDLRRGRQTIDWAPVRANGAPLASGVYRLRLAVTDDAGNVATAERAFRVHRSGRARVYQRVAGAGRRVALTFDDCNYRAQWRAILDILKEHDAKATFFCSGYRVRANPDLARRTVREGHTIGSHSWSHPVLTRVRGRRVDAQIAGDRAWWWRHAGTTSARYFRPPYGAYDRRVLRAAGRSGYERVIMWDVDPRDWKNPGWWRIRDRVVRGARPGSIVLLHVKPQTVRALPGMIRRLRAERNLEPVSLDELFAAARR